MAKAVHKTIIDGLAAVKNQAKVEVSLALIHGTESLLDEYEAEVVSLQDQVRVLTKQVEVLEKALENHVSTTPPEVPRRTSDEIIVS